MKTIAQLSKRTGLSFVIAIAFTATGFSQDAPSLSDPEVASVAVVANQIDISYAEIALEKSKNKEVREFAERMVTDHNAVIEQAVELVTKLSVTPKDNAVSKSLLEGAEKTKKELNSASEEEFDLLYVNNEVAYHEAVITAVKDLLIPASDNAELKGLLETVLPALQAHLLHAEMIQAKLKP